MYMCDCNPAWTGMDCEIEVDECDTAPCKNNGTCYVSPRAPHKQLPDMLSQTDTDTLSPSGPGGQLPLCVSRWLGPTHLRDGD